MNSSIGTRPAKDALFDGFARVAASMASGRRLEIIDVLAQAPRTVEEIAATIGQSVANTSHHLRRLADDGLVEAERDGRHVGYRLSSNLVYELWRSLQAVATAHHDEIGEVAVAYLGDRQELDQIDWETLQGRLGRGDDIVIIDVRPAVEYAAGHLDGAVSIIPERMDEGLAGLPGGSDVVAYCRGAYCAFADQAVRRLRASGRNAFRIDGGFRDLVPVA